MGYHMIYNKSSDAGWNEDDKWCSHIWLWHAMKIKKKEMGGVGKNDWNPINVYQKVHNPLT